MSDGRSLTRPDIDRLRAFGFTADEIDGIIRGNDPPGVNVDALLRASTRAKIEREVGQFGPLIAAMIGGPAAPRSTDPRARRPSARGAPHAPIRRPWRPDRSANIPGCSAAALS